MEEILYKVTFYFGDTFYVIATDLNKAYEKALLEMENRNDCDKKLKSIFLIATKTNCGNYCHYNRTL